MSRIDEIFTTSHKKALIPYLTVGYPDVATTIKTAGLLAENGADIIELGVPFSDPLADGVTIQNASFIALHNGITLETCLEVAAKIRQKIITPLVFMSYLNPIYKYGIEKFCQACSDAGVNGLIIPDLPPEEGSSIERYAIANDMDLIYLVAPTSTSTRIKMIAEHSHGYIYLVSEAGVTGVRNEIPAGLKDFISRVRNVTNQPLCVGFGISTPEQARRVAEIADGVIIGSKIIQLMEADSSLEKIREFIGQVRKAID